MGRHRGCRMSPERHAWHKGIRLPGWVKDKVAPSLVNGQKCTKEGFGKKPSEDTPTKDIPSHSLPGLHYLGSGEIDEFSFLPWAIWLTIAQWIRASEVWMWEGPRSSTQLLWRYSLHRIWFRIHNYFRTWTSLLFVSIPLTFHKYPWHVRGASFFSNGNLFILVHRPFFGEYNDYNYSNKVAGGLFKKEKPIMLQGR